LAAELRHAAVGSRTKDALENRLHARLTAFRHFIKFTMAFSTKALARSCL
jgi:hypothetical protein